MPTIIAFPASAHKDNRSVPLRHAAQPNDSTYYYSSSLKSALDRANNDHAALLIIRRLHQSIHGYHLPMELPTDIQRTLDVLRVNFRHKVDTVPYKQLVEEGHVNQLLDDFLGLLAIACEKTQMDMDMASYSAAKGWRTPDSLDADAHHHANRYLEERDYYYNHPELVKKIVGQVRHIIT